MSCWWCGGPRAPGDRFCPACGQSRRSGAPADPGLWPAEGENRVLTVLFPDLSGYMAASGQAPGEDAVLLVDAVLGTYIEIVHRHGGFIARCMHDEVLALFGIPTASADDPARALDAALAIRAAIRALGLDVKIGINTGLVYFGPVGSAEHAELAVVGTPADVAARLVGKGDRVALAGQILVGPSTEEQTRHRFELAAPRTLQLKGIRDPVTCHELVGRRDPVQRPAPANPDARWSDIAAGLDRLGRTPRQLLQVASVIGRRFDTGLLARVLPVAPDLAGAVAALIAAGWLDSANGGHAVRDPATADVLYRSLLPARRAALHAAVAGALESAGDAAGAALHRGEAERAGSAVEFANGLRLTRGTP